MSRDIPGLVETSTNLASVKMKDGNTIVVATSQQRSVESAQKRYCWQIENLFALAELFLHTETVTRLEAQLEISFA